MKSAMKADVRFKNDLSQALYFIRGIAIVLMVISHVIGDNKNSGMRQMYNSDLFGLSWLSDFIYTFHMPVFLIVSGVAFGAFSKKDGSYTEFVRSKLKRLIIPLLCWVPPFFVFHSLSKGNHFSLFDVVIKGVILPYSMFWFLHALIFASFFAFVCFRICSSSSIYFGVSIILFIISLAFNKLYISFYFSYNIYYAFGVYIAYFLPKFSLILERLPLTNIFIILSSCSIIMFSVKQFMIENYHSMITLINGIVAFIFLYIMITTYRLKFSYEPINKLLHLLKRNFMYAGKLSMVIYLLHMYFATVTRMILTRFLGVTNPSLHFILLHFSLGCFL